MTTPRAVDAPALQPKNPNTTSVARDVSITDMSWVASPRIFRDYVFVQTLPCLKGASTNHVC
jgi:hypothetical protein